MGLTSALVTARTGLSAASIGIEVTSNNVANAGTEGYSRRSVVQSTADPAQIGGLTVGRGVSVDRLGRAADSFLTQSITAAQGEASASASERDVLLLAESWFNDSEVDGLTSRLQSVFDSLKAATADPGDDTFRRSVAYTADQFASSLSRTATALTDLSTQTAEQIESSVEGVNEVLSEIASLNQRIISTGDPQGAGDLLDQRDTLVRSLSDILGVTTRIGDDGTATVLVGGHAVVSGVDYREISVGTDDEGMPKVLVAVDNGFIDVTDELEGEVGGALTALDAIDGYLDVLDGLAEDLTDAFNDVHGAGFDRNGDAGLDFFETDSSAGRLSTTFSFNSELLDDPMLLAFAGASSAVAGDGDNLAELLALEDSKVFDDDTATAEGVLIGLTTTIGSDVAAAEARAAHEAAVLGDLDSMRDSLAGVDLDEEAANLIKFQAAYQAAAKVLRATDELLGTLMDLV
jgi:flagellar hook-associated protein 1 FlgK